MLRIDDPNKAFYKRGLRSLYTTTQATPKDLFLDPAWDNSVDIAPGMVCMKTLGDLVTVINGVGTPYGLFGIYEAPSEGLLEVTRSGINAMPVWVLSADAEMQVINAAGNAKGFDDTVSWVDPGDGTTTLITYYSAGAKRGRLVPVGTSSAGGNTVASTPIARLLRVDSATSIVIGGLQARTA